MRFRWAAVVVAAAMGMAGCGARRAAPVGSGSRIILPSQATVSLQGYYDGNETSCADKPLVTRIRYAVASGYASLVVGVRGLPPSIVVLVNWLNNRERGYAVGTFTTDAAGGSVPMTMHLIRPGETHGIEILLTSSDSQSTLLGALRPCA